MYWKYTDHVILLSCDNHMYIRLSWEKLSCDSHMHSIKVTGYIKAIIH